MRGGVKIRFIKKWLFLKGWQKTDGKSNCCPIWVRSHLDGEKVVNNVRIHLISNSHKSSDVFTLLWLCKKIQGQEQTEMREPIGLRYHFTQSLLLKINPRHLCQPAKKQSAIKTFAATFT